MNCEFDLNVGFMTRCDEMSIRRVWTARVTRGNADYEKYCEYKKIILKDDMSRIPQDVIGMMRRAELKCYINSRHLDKKVNDVNMYLAIFLYRIICNPRRLVIGVKKMHKITSSIDTWRIIVKRVDQLRRKNKIIDETIMKTIRLLVGPFMRAIRMHGGDMCEMVKTTMRRLYVDAYNRDDNTSLMMTMYRRCRYEFMSVVNMYCVDYDMARFLLSKEELLLSPVESYRHCDNDSLTPHLMYSLMRQHPRPVVKIGIIFDILFNIDINCPSKTIEIIKVLLPHVLVTDRDMCINFSHAYRAHAEDYTDEMIVETTEKIHHCVHDFGDHELTHSLEALGIFKLHV